MWLTSNIFITKAIDSIDAYAHLGGDAAAHVSHAKDAAGVKSLNKLDVEGVHLLGHTVIDWHGERWVCQSMLPGIFSRPRDEEVDGTEKDDKEEEKKVNGDAKEDGEKKEDRVKVKGHSPNKSTESAVSEKPEEFGVNPMIIYGLDSEHLSSIHWDASTHKVMSKIASAYRLAEHKVKDGNGDKKDFYASAEVKALRGTDGRRYLLDLPRLAPVDVEWLEKDMEGKDGGEAYPHRVMLLRPELVETFWDNELKRWAREVAEKEKEADKEGDSSAIESCKANGDTPAIPEDQDQDQDRSPAAAEAVAHREEGAKPIEASPSTLKQFELRFNPDAFVDQPPPNNASDKSFFVPSATTDESDPAIKAVRDASVFLRQIAIPAIALDVLTGNTSGIMDGQSLSKHLHSRGVNMRYLGMLAGTIQQFSAGLDGKQRPGSGHLAALKVSSILQLKPLLIKFRESSYRRWCSVLASMSFGGLFAVFSQSTFRALSATS